MDKLILKAFNSMIPGFSGNLLSKKRVIRPLNQIISLIITLLSSISKIWKHLPRSGVLELVLSLNSLPLKEKVGGKNISKH